MAKDKKRPPWRSFKAQLDAAIKDIVTAEKGLIAAQAKLSKAQKTLRDLSDNPPGSVPDIGGP